MERRKFLATTFATLAAGPTLADHHGAKDKKKLFEISLAQWSHHRALRNKEFTNLEWPEHTKKNYGILGLEYVNRFFNGKAQDQSYLNELKKRVSDLGMTNVLIMVDGEGHIGAASDEKRQKTVDNHKKWIDAAKFLGCHSIRVNSHGEGITDEEKAVNCVKGLAALSQYAKDHEINVIVENHGGLSSNGAWMAQVLKDVGMDNCGSLPDFGNFHGYDRYKGLAELMPYAKGVSAKSREFDDQGHEVQTDFRKALEIVLEHQYHGWVGIEYEGKKHSEEEGIRLTKTLLEKVRDEMS